MAKKEKTYDVIIIGSGPAGSTAAIYAARADLSTLVIDKQIRAGALGVTSKVANYPGIPDVMTGEKMVGLFWQQAKSFGAEFRRERVQSTSLTKDPKVIKTAEGNEYRTKAVIIATGAMGRDRFVPGEEDYLGRGVSYCATCDGAFFRDQEVLVVGDNTEAIEEALFLTKFASKIYIANHRREFNADKLEIEKLQVHNKIEVLYGHRLRAIEGNSTMQSVKLVKQGKGVIDFPVQGLFIFSAGTKPIVDYLSDKLGMSKDGCVIVDEEMRTSIPGVYAAGDLLTNSVKQAVVASADGCIAALSVDKYIHQRKDFRKDYY